MWSIPKISGLRPKCFTRHFSDEEKQNRWVKVVAPVETDNVKRTHEGADSPVLVQSDLTLYATLINAKKTLERPFEGHKGYVHVIQTGGYNPGKAQGATVKISGPGDELLELKEGDGAYIFVGQKGNTLKVENVGNKTAEVIVFDLE